MEQKTYRVGLIVVMAAFLSAIFFAAADPSCAASGKKKAATAGSLSAVDHTEARIKELQSVLKITPAQEELWNNLTQVMRENAKEMDALAKTRSETATAMNAVEHLKLHSRITEARLDQMKRFIPPFEALYASMSDEQKKATDTLFSTGKHGKQKVKK